MPPAAAGWATVADTPIDLCQHLPHPSAAAVAAMPQAAAVAASEAAIADAQSVERRKARRLEDVTEFPAW